MSRQSVAIIALGAFNVLVLIALIIGGWAISYIWKAQEMDSINKITTLILQANDGLNNPAPIEPQTGQIFIPQARLWLPPIPQTAGFELEYRYSPAIPEFSEELFIVNQFGYRSARTIMISALNMEGMFNEVPKLQACSRGYQLSFSPIADNPNPLKFNKSLTDGRSLYVYIDSGCEQTLEDFDSYLQQIDSY